MTKKSKNIVLDLDSTLICSFLDSDREMQILSESHPKVLQRLISTKCLVPINVPNFGGSGTSTVYNIVMRPGVKSFLAFCKESFENVMVWSAGHPRYVSEIVRILDEDSKIFTAVYTSTHTVIYIKDRAKNKIVPVQTAAADIYSCPDVVLSAKPLTKISESHPQITLENTIIVDDLACNFGLPNPKNGVLIPPFKPKIADLLEGQGKGMDVIAGDLCLFRLIHYLSDDAFIEAEDVRKYDLKFFKEIYHPPPPSLSSLPMSLRQPAGCSQYDRSLSEAETSSVMSFPVHLLD